MGQHGLNLPLVSYLKLLGIRPGTARPMALINRSPFAQGESGDVVIVMTNQASKTEAAEDQYPLLGNPP